MYFILQLNYFYSCRYFEIVDFMLYVLMYQQSVVKRIVTDIEL
jgi:hypothetical protein